MTEPPPPVAAPAPPIGKVRWPIWAGGLMVLGWLGVGVEQAVSWTNPADGLMNGLLIGAFIAPFLLVYLGPLAAIGLLLGSWRPLLRWPRWLGLALPLVAILAMVAPGVRDRLEPGRRFERLTEVAFPRDARNLEVFWWGGLLADRTDTYTFDCPKAETERLIRELGLRPTEFQDRVNASGPGPRFAPLERGWPNPELWHVPGSIGPRTPPRGFHFLLMVTDESHTRVHIDFGTT